MAISNCLANTKTFKITNVVFNTLTEVGAQSQIVIEQPQLLPGDSTPPVRADLVLTCLIKEQESVFGSGIYFCQQLMKEELNGNNDSWKLFQNKPNEWIANRNIRKNLPPAYHGRTFAAVSERASAFRLNIITSMVTTKR